MTPQERAEKIRKAFENGGTVLSPNAVGVIVAQIEEAEQKATQVGATAGRFVAYQTAADQLEETARLYSGNALLVQVLEGFAKTFRDRSIEL